jgi:AcrR family transcriptional regulator
MPRAGLTAEAVVAAAGALADERGLDRVTLSELAGRLGVRPPSLYAHVGGLEDLRSRLATRGAEELAETLQEAAAGRAGGDALRAVGHAYRAYALSHPGAYAALQRAGTLTAPAADAASRVVSVVLAVLAGYGLHGDPALHATRAIRAALHGFVTLETDQGFGLPLALGESFETLLRILDSGLRGA